MHTAYGHRCSEQLKIFAVSTASVGYKITKVDEHNFFKSFSISKNVLEPNIYIFLHSFRILS